MNHKIQFPAILAVLLLAGMATLVDAHMIRLFAKAEYDGLQVTISGTVENEQGGPIADAELQLTGAANAEESTQSIATTRTDADGRFVFINDSDGQLLDIAQFGSQCEITAQTADGHSARKQLHISSDGSLPHDHAHTQTDDHATAHSHSTPSHSAHTHGTETSPLHALEHQLDEIERRQSRLIERFRPGDILSGVNTILICCILWLLVQRQRKSDGPPR